MRKAIAIILLLKAAFLTLFSCNGSFFDPYVTNMRDGGFGPNPKDNGKTSDNGGNPNYGELRTLSGNITITSNSGITIGTELTASYSGNEAVSYQWQKDGVNVGENSGKYTPTEPGSYTVTVSVVGFNPKTSEAVIVGNPVPEEYAIEINILDNLTGDTVTASPNKGIEGATITLTYTVANMAHYNQLEFGGVTALIAPVSSAESGTRIYTIHAADSSNEVITITAVFTHTDLIIDHIAFSEHDNGHITKTYGDSPFTNAVTTAHKGDGAIIYNSSDEKVATVNDYGLVTIFKPGFAVISAEKVADDVYAHAMTNYTLTVNPKPVTITGLSASNKVYDGTTTATVTGTAVINGLVSGDTVTVIAGTASFANAAAGNNKTVTFSGYSLTGADAGNYTLSAQPAAVTANIVPITLSGTITINPNSGVKTGTELTATYSGNENVIYQWQRDGTNVGTNSNKYTPTEAGSYTVTVSAVGYTSKTSAAVYVTLPSVEIVIDWTNIDEWQLIEQSVQATANVDRVFTVTGSYTSYHWYLDGASVGTSSTYTFNKPDDVYQLVVVVTNSNGESRSGRCRITVSN